MKKQFSIPCIYLLLLCTVFSCKKDLQVYNAESTASTSADQVATRVSAVFISGSDSVFCLNALTGATIWTYKVPAPIISAPCIKNGVFFFNVNDSLYALNINNGSLLWKSYTNYFSNGALCVANDKVYIHTLPALLCFNAKNGNGLWHAKISVIDGYETCSSPTVVNNTVYVGGNLDHSVSAFDATTGTIKWRFDGFGHRPTEFTVISSPCVIGNKVFCTHINGRTFALDTLTGSVIWANADPGHSITGDGSYTASAGKIYQTASVLICRDQATGNKLWAQDLSTRDCFVDDTVVYTASNYSTEPKLFALSAGNGNILWSYDLPDNCVTPVKAGNVLYYTSSSSGILYALDASSRNILWSKNINRFSTMQSIVVALTPDNIIYPAVSGMTQ